MNNREIPVLFLARRVPAASNGRGNFKFKNDILYSYDDVIATFTTGGELLVSGDTFSATSSRHQSAIKRIAEDYTLVPDLNALVDIMRDRNPEDVDKYVLHRKMAVSDYDRKIERSKSENMREYYRERIRLERDAAVRAIKMLPLHEAAARLRIFSGRS